MARVLPLIVDRAGMPARLLIVRKAFVLALLLAASSMPPLHAQFFDASHVGGTVTITVPWRFHTGDDPQWASPNFDDSQWSLLRMDKPWNAQGYGAYSGYGWYRIRLQLPASEEPLALGIASAGLLPSPGNSAEFYADGTLIGVRGKMRPAPKWLADLPNITVIQIPTALNGKTIEIAIRFWQVPLMPTSFLGEFSWPLPVLGTEQTIRAFHDRSINQSLLTWLPDLLLALVALVIGQISFGLFLLRPRATEYAWAGLFLFGSALYPAFDLYRQAHHLPNVGSVLALILIGTGGIVGWLFLVWRFMNARADWFFRTAIFLVLSRPVSFLLVAAGHLTVAHDSVLVALLWVCTGLLVFVRLVHEARRGNRDAQIFLVPFLLYSVALAVTWILNALHWSGVFLSEAASSSLEGPALYPGPNFTVTWDQLGALLSFLAIGAVLVRRFTRSAEQEQRLATEMEAARQVQAKLVPLDFPHFAGFQIEAAYLPASEVGGDFYQVLAQCDGSLLIVIGDVCGKGLKAAMTGVLAIGAVRALASQGLDPGLLLTRLNREIARSQNEGFITCICAHVSRDGAVTFADAGHPAPYRNGEEIDVQSSLPLGITPDIEYTETRTQLVPGDRLTFLSDGVVEARSNVEGFFGFDRMREISRQPARTIANAAQRFGQEDDITVLSITRTDGMGPVLS